MIILNLAVVVEFTFYLLGSNSLIERDSLMTSTWTDVRNQQWRNNRGRW